LLYALANERRLLIAAVHINSRKQTFTNTADTLSISLTKACRFFCDR
jgi:threonine aldolase